MCSVMVASTILDVLGAMVNDGKVFTAYDVTKEARSTTSDNVRGYEVRGIVHNEYQTGQISGYNRELCALEIDGSPQAFVYYPDGKSASDHPLVEDSSTEDDIKDDVDGVVVSAEGAGRVNIPKQILKQVSSNGDSYDFMVNGSLTCRKVNANGAIRFSLKSLGISGGQCRVSIDNDVIYIEQA